MHRKFLLVSAAGLALGIFAAMRLPPGAQLAKGVLLGATLVYRYGFAHFCFVILRQFALLKRQLTRATPVQLVLAKFASAFSMALFIVNIPGLMLRDLDFLFYDFTADGAAASPQIQARSMAFAGT